MQRNLKTINKQLLKTLASFIITLANLLEWLSPFIHHKYTEITYLTIIPRARMDSEAEGRMGY